MHEEIIVMAREAGFDMSNLPSIRASNVYGEVNDELERFAALVAAKEREAIRMDLSAEGGGSDLWPDEIDAVLDARSQQ